MTITSFEAGVRHTNVCYRMLRPSTNNNPRNQGDSHVSQPRYCTHCTCGHQLFCRDELRLRPWRQSRQIRVAHNERCAIEVRRRGDPSGEKAVAQSRGGVLPQLHARRIRRGLGQFLRFCLLRRLIDRGATSGRRLGFGRSAVAAAIAACPLCSGSGQTEDRAGKSALCQEATHRSNPRLFDYLVGAQQDRGWQLKSTSLWRS